MAQGTGEDAGVDGMADVADAQPARLATAQATPQGFQALGVLEQGLGLMQEGPAIGGEAQALLAALEQLQAEALLELGDLPAQRRLGNMQLLGGAAHVLDFGHGDEITELSEIQHMTFKDSSVTN
ncbi:hypothetical protein D3C85_1165910 [compost metagenome]